MQISTQTYNACVPAESSSPKSAFSDVHGARLLCWSAALFSVSLWMASLFFDAQFDNWNAARHEQDRIAELRLSNPSWERTVRQIKARAAARQASLQRTAPHTNPSGNLTSANWHGAVR